MRVLSNMLINCTRLPDYLLLRAFTHALRSSTKAFVQPLRHTGNDLSMMYHEASCIDNYTKVCKRIASKIFIIILSVFKRTLH